MKNKLLTALILDYIYAKNDIKFCENELIRGTELNEEKINFYKEVKTRRQEKTYVLYMLLSRVYGNTKADEMIKKTELENF